MIKKIIPLILPPFIGGFLLTGMALYYEKQKDYRGIEPCETFTLSFSDFLILLLALTMIGGLVEIGIVGQIIKIFKIQKINQWIALGGILAFLMGLGICKLKAYLCQPAPEI